MSGKLSQEVKAEPNLTPILDMVFQLVTFFMLVINFKTAEMVFANLGGINKYAGVNPAYKDFAPRLGLAYTITPKTVFRMGYGRSYAVNTGGANFGTYCCQWPVGSNQSLNSSTLYNELFPLSQGPPDASTALVAVPSSGRLLIPNGQAVYGRPFNDNNTSLDAWNATVQRQLTSTMTFEIGYVGLGAAATPARASTRRPGTPKASASLTKSGLAMVTAA